MGFGRRQCSTASTATTDGIRATRVCSWTSRATFSVLRRQGDAGLRCYKGDGMSCGTVFELSPTTGIETVLHYFGEKSGKQGARPFGGLIQDAEGNFYGTTAL